MRSFFHPENVFEVDQELIETTIDSSKCKSQVFLIQDPDDHRHQSVDLPHFITVYNFMGYAADLSRAVRKIIYPLQHCLR